MYFQVRQSPRCLLQSDTGPHLKPGIPGYAAQAADGNDNTRRADSTRIRPRGFVYLLNMASDLRKYRAADEQGYTPGTGRGIQRHQQPASGPADQSGQRVRLRDGLLFAPQDGGAAGRVDQGPRPGVFQVGGDIPDEDRRDQQETVAGEADSSALSHRCGGREVRGAEFGEGLLHTGDGQTPEVPAVDLVAAGRGPGGGGRGAPGAAQDFDLALMVQDCLVRLLLVPADEGDADLQVVRVQMLQRVFQVDSGACRVDGGFDAGRRCGRCGRGGGPVAGGGRARAMAAAELYGASGPTLSSISCCMAGSSP